MRRVISSPSSIAPSLAPAGGGAAAALASSEKITKLSLPSAVEPLAGKPERSFAKQVRFLSRGYDELDLRFDPVTRSLWSYLRPNGNPSFTPSMVQELVVMHRALKDLIGAQPPDAEPLFRYYVQRSLIPGIYNMGGDFGFLIENIQRGNSEAIRQYAYGCVEAVYHIATGFDSGMVSVCLLEGDALGGGLEGALCCHHIIAERKVKLGFPEILFNCFPGMGAYSLLARRIEPYKVERLIFSGKVYSAEEMYEMGVIDHVVDDGAGEKAVWDYIGDERKFPARRSIYQGRNRVNPLTLSELQDVTDLWVRTVMSLSPADLRRMKHLQHAQTRRLRQTSPGS